MKRPKTISSLILTLFGIWFFQYFTSYIPGAFTIIVVLLGISLWFLLLSIVFYQVIKLASEETKHYERLIYVSIIIILNALYLTHPKGIIDWEKYEGENILVASWIGTVFCQTTIKLKYNNKFKYTSRCFGVDFYFGTYKLSNDTLYFELDKDVGYMDKSTYAVLLKSQKDTTKYNQIILHKNYKDKQSLNFSIREIKMEEFLNQK